MAALRGENVLKRGEIDDFRILHRGFGRGSGMQRLRRRSVIRRCEPCDGTEDEGQDQDCGAQNHESYCIRAATARQIGARQTD